MRFGVTELREEILASLKEKARAARNEEKGYILSIHRVGENQPDLAYERGLKKSAQSAGIDVDVHCYPEDVETEALLEGIRRDNENPAVGGILVFHPLPDTVDSGAVDAAVAIEKDIDCLHPDNQRKVYAGGGVLYPATAKSALAIAEAMGPLEGKRALIVNRSMVIGKPLAMMLLDKNATVTIAHSRTRNLEEEAKRADLVVYATGKSRWINERFVREGQWIVDCGIAFDENGKMTGDVDTEAVEKIVEYVTPVPGGVGSLTNLLLLENMFLA